MSSKHTFACRLQLKSKQSVVTRTRTNEREGKNTPRQQAKRHRLSTGKAFLSASDEFKRLEVMVQVNEQVQILGPIGEQAKSKCDSAKTQLRKCERLAKRNSSSSEGIGYGHRKNRYLGRPR